MRIKYISLSCILAALCLLSFFTLAEMPLVNSAPRASNIDGTWIDQFSDTELDSRWVWIREDPLHWSLTNRPGFLRISTQSGGIRFDTNNMKNILLASPTLEDFVIIAKVSVSPNENIQGAYLYIYQDDDNYIAISRRYADGNDVKFIVEGKGQFLYSTSLPESATTLYLRLTKKGNLYIGSYSTDANKWTEVGQYYFGLEDFMVGFGAAGGPSEANIPADFDYFQFDEFDRTTLYVAPGAACGGAEPCFGTIQAAVDAAAELDLIKISAGTYSDLHQRPSNYSGSSTIVTQVVYISKSLDIQGGYTPANWIDSDPMANPAILDAGGGGRGMYIIGSIFPTIEGLQITGGDATGLGGAPLWAGADDTGGGVFVLTATATLADNWIFNNTAHSGGGVYLSCSCWDFPEVLNPTLSGNVIISNTAFEGGGISLIQSDANIIDNVISHNSSDRRGGGFAMQFASPTLSANNVRDNIALNSGAGLSMQWGYPTLINNVIADNQVKNNNIQGNALYNLGAYPTLLHNTIARNSGGDGSAIFIEDLFEWTRPYLTMTNNIMVDQKVGIVASGISTVTLNGILWYNTPVTVTKGASAMITVQNEITGDPAFDADGFHLTEASAAIDKGVNSDVVLDIDGESRPMLQGYDLGADEFNYKFIYLPFLTKQQR